MTVAPIGNAGTLARVGHLQVPYTIRKNIEPGDAGKVIVIGIIPAKAWLKGASGAYVSTAFNAGTANTVDVGTQATGNAYASALALGSTGYKALTAGVTYIATETIVYATVTLSGTAPTTGLASIILEYYPDLG